MGLKGAAHVKGMAAKEQLRFILERHHVDPIYTATNWHGRECRSRRAISTIMWPEKRALDLIWLKFEPVPQLLNERRR